MGFFKRRILSFQKEIREEIFKNHLGLIPSKRDWWLTEMIADKVSDILISCSDRSELPEQSGRTYWAAISFPTAKYEQIAEIFNQGIYEDEKRYTENNIKKHISDTTKKVFDCVKKKVNGIDWKRCVKKAEDLRNK